MGANGKIEPYIINKNMGQPMEPYGHELPQKNSDGLQIVEPTEEQKYLFDTHGWLLIPDVLSQDEVDEMREWILKLHFDGNSVAEHERTVLSGPTQRLVDHPMVAGMLNEFTANPHLSSQECYGYCLGGANFWYRTAPGRRNEGKREAREFKPHNGNGLYRLPGDVHFYNSFPGKSFCPHMRVVFELNPVKYRQGGTFLIKGSHKATFTAPDEILDWDSDVWTTYACSPGSLLFFAEATTHSATPWTNEENDRCAVALLYNQVDGGWAPELKPHEKVLDSMPAMRRTLFRERYVAGNVLGADFKRLF